MAGRQKISLFLVLMASLVILGAYHVLDAGRAHLVKQVFDGDTLALEDGTRVRLIGVDAPEVDSPYSNREPFGERPRSRQWATISPVMRWASRKGMSFAAR